jgi:hypothetical protein
MTGTRKRHPAAFKARVVPKAATRTKTLAKLSGNYYRARRPTSSARTRSVPISLSIIEPLERSTGAIFAGVSGESLISSLERYLAHTDADIRAAAWRRKVVNRRGRTAVDFGAWFKKADFRVTLGLSARTLSGPRSSGFRRLRG